MTRQPNISTLHLKAFWLSVSLQALRSVSSDAVLGRTECAYDGLVNRIGPCRSMTYASAATRSERSAPLASDPSASSTPTNPVQNVRTTANIVSFDRSTRRSKRSTSGPTSSVRASVPTGRSRLPGAARPWPFGAQRGGDQHRRRRTDRAALAGHGRQPRFPLSSGDVRAGRREAR